MGDDCEGLILDTQDCLAEGIVPEVCPYVPYEWSETSWSDEAMNDFGELEISCSNKLKAFPDSK